MSCPESRMIKYVTLFAHAYGAGAKKYSPLCSLKRYKSGNPLTFFGTLKHAQIPAFWVQSLESALQLCCNILLFNVTQWGKFMALYVLQSEVQGNLTRCFGVYEISTAFYYHLSLRCLHPSYTRPGWGWSAKVIAGFFSISIPTLLHDTQYSYGLQNLTMPAAGPRFVGVHDMVETLETWSSRDDW